MQVPSVYVYELPVCLSVCGTYVCTVLLTRYILVLGCLVPTDCLQCVACRGVAHRQFLRPSLYSKLLHHACTCVRRSVPWLSQTSELTIDLSFSLSLSLSQSYSNLLPQQPLIRQTDSSLTSTAADSLNSVICTVHVGNSACSAVQVLCCCVVTCRPGCPSDGQISGLENCFAKPIFLGF